MQRTDPAREVAVHPSRHPARGEGWSSFARTVQAVTPVPLAWIGGSPSTGSDLQRRKRPSRGRAPQTFWPTPAKWQSRGEEAVPVCLVGVCRRSSRRWNCISAGQCPTRVTIPIGPYGRIQASGRLAVARFQPPRCCPGAGGPSTGPGPRGIGGRRRYPSHHQLDGARCRSVVEFGGRFKVRLSADSARTAGSKASSMRAAKGRRTVRLPPATVWTLSQPRPA